MKLGCSHPMGPLTLLDFVGLDTTYYIAQIMFDEFKDPLMAPPPLLKRMVLVGQFGRKSGRCFYEYKCPPSEERYAVREYPGRARRSRRRRDAQQTESAQ